MLAAAVLSAATVGAEVPRALKRGPHPLKAQSGKRVHTLDSDRRIDVNTLNMWVTNFGSFAFDLTTGNAGLVYPKGTAKTAVFASGLWMGALVNGEPRLAIAEYGQEYSPGVMLDDSTFDDSALPQYIPYKVVRYTGNAQDTAHVERSAEETAADPLLDPLLHHSWSEYLNGAAPYGAPTRLWHMPVTDTPQEGDSVFVLGPDVSGDQMIWSVYNDLDPSTRGATDAGNTDPMGVEVQQSTFGFEAQGALGNTLFLKFLIINKGENNLLNMFVSLWADPDLGGFTDDLVGVDTTLSLGYCYNATNNDQLYGLTPPAVGYDFFQGPKVGNQFLGLRSFNKYINGTDPASATQTYNYMRGVNPDGSLLIDPTTGLPTTFFHHGDPVTNTGWLDANPNDRRFLLTTGPFDMAPGDTQTVVGAIVIGQGTDRLSSISGLRFFDQTAQLAFDLGFQLPPPPQQPTVTVTEDHGEINLCWDTASRFGPQAPGFTFEGYNVYQGETVAGPWKRIATFDEANKITTVYEPSFDVTTGRVIPLSPTAFGSDAGITYCFSTTEDNIRGGSLKDGTQYYFAVTAYSVDTLQVFPNRKVLENAQRVLRVMPQRPAGGTDFSTASPTDVAYAQANAAQKPSTAEVSVEVVDPYAVTGHDYRVEFFPVDSVFTRPIAGDTATATVAWRLIDATTNTVKLDNQLNLRGNDDFPVVDGMRVRVASTFFPTLSSVDYVDLNPSGARRMDIGFSWSGNPDLYFLGGAGPASIFHEEDNTPFTTSLNPAAQPDSFTRVEMIWGAANPQLAYRYLRYEVGDTTRGDTSAFIFPGTAPVGGRRYAYGGYVNIPARSADLLRGDTLEMAFVERVLVDSLTGAILPDSAFLPGTTKRARFQPTTFDTTWFPSADAATFGGREYLWVLSRPYRGTPNPAFEVDGVPVSVGSPLPALYALWPKQRFDGDTRWLGDGLQYAWSVPPTPNDSYTFSTSRLVQNNAALAKANLANIRVVPNPYYTRSRYELNQFNRMIRFTNLPERATIRIFSLSGELVRTLEKTDPTSSVVTWDVLTENRLPVGSGVYIYHIDAPGVGSTIGRLVVFMEKERLNNL
jgi:hypothetical protein